MLDFLINYGLSEDSIKRIIDVNSSANLYNFSCNQYDVIEMIEYLKNIGVRNIEFLLRSNINLFLTDVENFKDKINKYDKDKFIDMINKGNLVFDKL